MADDSLQPRRGWRMWLAAAAGGAALVAVFAIFLVMLTRPDVKLARTDKASDAAPARLRALLDDAARRAHAGDFSGVDASTIDRGEGPFDFHAHVVGTALVIVARGNLDADPEVDDWQITSLDGTPLHVYDDARNLWVDSALPDVFEMPSVGENPDLPPSDRVRLAATIAAYRKSRQAKVVLEDLANDEVHHLRTKGSYVLFETLTPKVWAELADSTNGQMSFSVRATVSGTSILLTAIGNVDADPCLDVWATRPGDPVPEHLQDDVVLDICAHGNAAH